MTSFTSCLAPAFVHHVHATELIQEAVEQPLYRGSLDPPDRGGGTADHERFPLTRRAGGLGPGP